jgi:serine/threonine kinase 32
VGPPPDWVKPSNLPAGCVTGGTGSPVSINATSKSQKSTVGSPTSGSPPIPTKCNGNREVTSSPHTLLKTVTAPERPTPVRPPTAGTKARHGVRNQSASGGVSVTLDGTGSWSDLADKSAPVKSKPSGMLGFLSKKRGRASSPKPQERGVLSSREGGRVVIA